VPFRTDPNGSAPIMLMLQLIRIAKVIQ